MSGTSLSQEGLRMLIKLQPSSTEVWGKEWISDPNEVSADATEAGSKYTEGMRL